MPSDTEAAAGGSDPLAARCYCGALRFCAQHPPLTVAYCHCADCRRWTGAPVGAFAGVPADAPDGLGRAISPGTGATRWSCPDCGSPLAARFDCLPGQLHVPGGLFDDPSRLPPALHADGDSAVAWLHSTDDLPRVLGSSRTALNRRGAP